MSALGSAPTISASTRLPSANWTKSAVARRSAWSPTVTTCALVTISPRSLTTKPEPCPRPPPPSSPPAPSSKTESMVTTPGASRR
jgi:hypothetical protein